MDELARNLPPSKKRGAVELPKLASLLKEMTPPKACHAPVMVLVLPVRVKLPAINPTPLEPLNMPA